MIFPPEADLRIMEVAAFLELMRQAFDVSDWRTSRDKVFQVSPAEIESYLDNEGRVRPSSRGGILTLGPVDGNYPIMLSVSTGSNEYVWDFMWVDFHASDGVPDISYFRRCIEACRPTVAEISHSDNLESLSDWERAHSQGRKGVAKRPVVINWFHYFNKQMADTFGGLVHCLRTPAYKVEQFCDGILIQLTPQPLDPNSQQDLLAQRQAMEHLGLPWEFGNN